MDIEVDAQDIEGVAGYAKDVDGRYKVGTRNLLQREFDIPNELVEDFIETDVDFILRGYSRRMGAAVEITREFGDTHMVNFLDNLEIKLLEKILIQQNAIKLLIIYEMKRIKYWVY